jgi:hypothetical protein
MFHFNTITFQINLLFYISLGNAVFPDYEIPIKLKKITDNRIKHFITSKKKDKKSCNF